MGLFDRFKGDKEFAGLSPQAQDIVLSQTDPEYAGLSDGAKATVKKTLFGGVSTGPGPVEGLQNIAGSIGKGLQDFGFQATQASTYENLLQDVYDALDRERVTAQQDPFYALKTFPTAGAGALQSVKNIADGALGLPAAIGNAYQGSQEYQPAIQTPELPSLFQGMLQERPATAFLGEQLPYMLPFTSAAGGAGALRAAGEGAAIGALQPGELDQRVAGAAMGAAVPTALGTAVAGLKAVPAKAPKTQSDPIGLGKIRQVEGVGGPPPDFPGPLPSVQGSGPQKLRGYVRTLKESPNTVPDVADKLSSSYNVFSDAEALQAARELIDSDYDTAYRLASSNKKPDKFSFTVAQELADRMQKTGQIDQAVDLLTNVAEQATTAGQAIQALKLWSRLTPVGAMRAATKLAEKAGAKLDPKLAKEISDIATEVQKMPEGNAKNVRTAELMAKIAKAEPAGVGKKLASIQVMGQLLNTKTIGRNIIGNAGFAAAERVSDAVATSVDIVLSKFTGKRTKAMAGPDISATGFYRGAKAGARDAIKGIDTSRQAGKFELPNGQVFENPVLQGVQKALDLGLKAPDRAFYEMAYRESLMGQVKASGQRKITPEMRAIAHGDALYKTFQDESVTAKAFMGLKKVLNQLSSPLTGTEDFGLGNLILNYPKTPANLLNRAVAYSPAGFVKSAWEVVRPMIGREFNQKSFVESIGRATTGTGGAFMFGAALGKLGIASGEQDDDKDIAAAQKGAGLGPNRINATALMRFTLKGFDPKEAKPKKGDFIVSYDWFQPLAVPFSAGVNYGKGGKLDDRKLGEVKQFISAATTGADTLAEQPLVSGVTRAFRSQDPIKGLEATAAGLPASLVPTALNQVNQLIDNTAKETGDASAVQQGLNQARAKIPGLAQTLPARRTPSGKPQEVYQGGSNNLFNVALNPAFVTQYQPDELNQEILRLEQTTGETMQALPLVTKKPQVSINGRKFKLELDAEKIADYQKRVGQVNAKLAGTAIKSPLYAKLSDDQKVKLLQGIYTDSNSAARIKLFQHQPKRVSKLGMAILANNAEMANALVTLKMIRMLQGE